jgi:hypothetical protein
VPHAYPTLSTVQLSTNHVVCSAVRGQCSHIRSIARSTARSLLQSTTLHNYLHGHSYSQLHYTVINVIINTVIYTVIYTVVYTVIYTVIYTMPVQRSRGRIGFKNVESGWTQLMETFNDIELSLRLTKGHIRRIKTVAENEKTKRSGASLKQHKFLRKVLAINSDSYTLCVVAFSQNQIDSTKAAILDGLVERIRERRKPSYMPGRLHHIYNIGMNNVNSTS